MDGLYLYFYQGFDPDISSKIVSADPLGNDAGDFVLRAVASSLNHTIVKEEPLINKIF